MYPSYNLMGFIIAAQFLTEGSHPVGHGTKAMLSLTEISYLNLLIASLTLFSTYLTSNVH